MLSWKLKMSTGNLEVFFCAWVDNDLKIYQFYIYLETRKQNFL